MNGNEIQGDLSKIKEDYNLQTDAILYNDNTKDNNLIQSIIKVQQQGLNCLDLSKKNIKEFPSQILELTLLQYLYLEGNQLTQLPNDLFLRLPHLKWLDLRNNQLVSIPSLNLAKHRSLQYLLLSGNHLRTLPFELGKVKTLSALNLDGNPLDYPPFQIIKQGIKSIQQYLRSKLHSNDEFSSSSSDNDNQPPPPPTPRFHPLLPRKSNSEFGYYPTVSQSNFLPSHLQSCIQYKRISYSAIRPSTPIRSRPQSQMKFSQVKTKIDIKKTDHNNHREINRYKIPEQQPLMHLKHRDLSQSLRQKSFLTSADYEEPLVHTPFHIDPHYIQMVKKDHQFDTRRTAIPGDDDDDEKRKHDRQIQDRIRQITDKMLKRRLQARSNTFEENRQVKIELRELRRLELDVGKKLKKNSEKIFLKKEKE